MENPLGNVIRPLNSKHAVSAIIAFALTAAGDLVDYADGHPEQVALLKKKISAAKAAKKAKSAEVEPEGDDLAGKAE